VTRTRLTAWLTAIWLGTGTCTVNIPGNNTTLFATGDPFILKGTTAVIDNSGPCLVWIGENGITYHLFQGGRLENADFDRITTPGVTSRLELAARSDLTVSCQVGEIVEVQRVLEIVE
jgi:hypothetical protein